MIGKPVTGKELEDLIADQEQRDNFRAELIGEIHLLKPGECLLYECEEGQETTLGAALMFSPGEKIKVIPRPGKVYVYKEK